MGALTPIGNNLNNFWQSMIQGQSGAAPITRFDASRFKTQFACELKNYEPGNYFDKSEIRRNDPFVQYALIAAAEAITHSHLLDGDLNKDRVGVIWGSGYGGITTFEEQMKGYAANNYEPRFNPFFIPKIIVDIASGMIAMKYGFRGINFATVSACATSTTSIMDAFNYIRLGKANVMITGGSEAAITEASLGGFGSMKALSQLNHQPTVASRPFDLNRDGFVMGEGAGALVLEELSHALNRGAQIYAEVAGAGASADAYHLTATHPEGEGAVLGMRMALEDAGLLPEDIDYVNMHATSTNVGDISEIKALNKVFAGHTGLHASATKSMTGHLLGAAGAVEAIACVMSILHQQVPPTINLHQLDPDIKTTINLTPNHAIAKNVQVAMSNTFGFGGHNASLIVKAFKP